MSSHLHSRGRRTHMRGWASNENVYLIPYTFVTVCTQAKCVLPCTLCLQFVPLATFHSKPFLKGKRLFPQYVYMRVFVVFTRTPSSSPKVWGQRTRLAKHTPQDHVAPAFAYRITTAYTLQAVFQRLLSSKRLATYRGNKGLAPKMWHHRVASSTT